MKLSFSTRGWLDLPWQELVDTALDMRFGGIEIYNLHKTELQQKGGAFHKYQITATLRELREKKLPEDAPVLALTTQEGLAPVAYAVTGARALRSAAIAGTAVHMLGGILGLLMLAVLAILGEAYLLTPMNVLLYGILWMIPGLLITEWTRSI